MTDKKVYLVSIVVFKSVPQDYRKKRHLAIWCDPQGGSTYFFEAIGSTQAFAFNVRPDYNPLTSSRFAKLIRIGSFQKSVTPNELDQEMRSVEMQNDDIEFTCQNWVMAALKKLAEDGWLTEDQSIMGQDQMIDAILEAADDE